MIEIDSIVSKALEAAIVELYGTKPAEKDLLVQQTRKEFEGDRTVVVFPFLKLSKKNPEVTANELGEHILNNLDEVESFNVIKGFLNLEISSKYWLQYLSREHSEMSANDGVYMVEYSSPNTNKPLHLGHIRNNLLGYSVSEILKANNKNVLKVQVINDRGIHICKSMLAWKRYGNGETPESSGKKGDHLVGDYYVRFDQEYKKEISDLIGQGRSEEEAKKEAPILLEAQKMLRSWEAKDADVIALWEKMNGWVYDGFNATYETMGVDFNHLYYESETYLTGKEVVMQGVKDGIFVQKEDGSVWVDLREDGLDEKILIRSDGTSVYMTQDIGTAILRFRDYPELSHLIYTVGNEQNYHFKVLFLILKKLGYEWAEGCRHLSYGMVELPSGKMKSREGTVVDADDLMLEMQETAKMKSEALGKLEGMSEDEKNHLYHVIGMGALKYFILKVDPKKQIVFNPEESIDFAGNTGPFIQYTHARIHTLLEKNDSEISEVPVDISISSMEKDLLKELYLYDQILGQAASELDPSSIANYTYELVRKYNHFYQAVGILKEEDAQLRNMRLSLSGAVAGRIKESMALLGIEVPNKM